MRAADRDKCTDIRENAEKTDAANIEAQFETKITLIKFIRKMWRNGLILENGTNGTNTTEKK